MKTTLKVIGAYIATFFVLAIFNILVNGNPSRNEGFSSVIALVAFFSFIFWTYYFRKKSPNNKQNKKQIELQKLKDSLDRDRAAKRQQQSETEKFITKPFNPVIKPRGPAQAVEINGLDSGDIIIFDYVNSKGEETNDRQVTFRKATDRNISGACHIDNRYKHFLRSNIKGGYITNIATGEVIYV
ncbi:hypothetical protein [Francisella philomiragia]|uniref:Uncharacterized protein n=1 Tax=Francisella philomiragia TaxID=28110 RepID=A0ABS1GET3_9GAMM|nr:hypothetical protein [Francisella philomiragia]MBK2259573.1 hypothetical protein [Francisella philomiragia]MBK2303265.1 hypothetical protein [Francisella philomiragia]